MALLAFFCQVYAFAKAKCAMSVSAISLSFFHVRRQKLNLLSTMFKKVNQYLKPLFSPLKFQSALSSFNYKLYCRDALSANLFIRLVGNGWLLGFRRHLTHQPTHKYTNFYFQPLKFSKKDVLAAEARCLLCTDATS